MYPQSHSTVTARPVIVTIATILLWISGIAMIVITVLSWMGTPVTNNPDGVYAVNPLLLRTIFAVLAAIVLGVVGWQTMGLLGGKRGARLAAFVLVPFIPLLSTAIAILGLGGQHFEAAILIVQFVLVGLLFPLCLLTVVLLCLPPASRYLTR